MKHAPSTQRTRMPYALLVFTSLIPFIFACAPASSAVVVLDGTRDAVVLPATDNDAFSVQTRVAAYLATNNIAQGERVEAVTYATNADDGTVVTNRFVGYVVNDRTRELAAPFHYRTIPSMRRVVTARHDGALSSVTETQKNVERYLDAMNVLYGGRVTLFESGREKASPLVLATGVLLTERRTLSLDSAFSVRAFPDGRYLAVTIEGKGAFSTMAGMNAIKRFFVTNNDYGEGGRIFCVEKPLHNNASHENANTHVYYVRLHAHP